MYKKISSFVDFINSNLSVLEVGIETIGGTPIAFIISCHLFRTPKLLQKL
ncbi:hypothetical protein [Metabacillus arenae]|uniref:Uncharacterized protein n=1 Tax=Metabacillus arenae TaxID=2771434 RepID=A0A926RXL2_9BACI|nr:hypothetical protein [Metabacillus arenae]MBD1381106.1 hypothetical protein [Metabacillus arenae]